MVYTLSLLDWGVMAAYMLGMVLIGVYSSRKVHGYEDYILSGRNVPTYYLAPCLLTTQIGAGSIIGYVGLCYKVGISGGWWIYGNIVTFVALALIGAIPLREAIGAKTLPEWYKLRYNENCRVFTAITTLIAEIAFTAGQIVGGGLLLSVLLGYDVKICIFMFAVIVSLYSVIGGLWAVFLTDFVQMFIMFVGFTALIYFGLRDAGGMDGVWAAVPEGFFDLIPRGSLASTIALILYSIPSIFCAFDVIQKIMAAKSPKVARDSCYWASGGVLFFAVMVPMIGILGYVLLGPSFENPEMISVTLIRDILPGGLKGLAMAAVLATLMSSTDACVMAASSVMSNDLLPKVIDYESLSEKQKLRLSVLTTAVLAVLTWALATWFDSALGNMEIAWTALSCGAFIPLIFGLLWKRTTAQAAFASMICGCAAGLLWLFLNNPYGLRPVIPAYIVGIAVIIAVTLMGPKETQRA